MLACRRATLEWVMRSAVQATGKVNFLSGVTVSGLLVSDDPERRIRGLQLAGGEEHLADIVVVADGRRSGLPKWLKAVGIALDDDVEEPAGIQYFSRFYRLDDGVDFPTTSLVANDLGYLFYAAFCGDNGHFSLALSANDDDDELRHALQDPAHYENAVRQIPELQPWINSGTPVTGIFPMAGLINRRRHFVRDGKPVLAGLHVIGDAHIATNPAYGRGLSLAIWQARLLSDAVAVEPTDLGRQSALFCEAVQEHIVPWFDISVMMDSSRREERERKLAEGDAHAAVDNPMKSLADAANVDPQVWRTFWRVMNLLEPPETLMAPEFIERIMEVVGNLPEPAPASEVLPPVRTEMLSALGFSGH